MKIENCIMLNFARPGDIHIYLCIKTYESSLLIFSISYISLNEFAELIWDISWLY